MLRKIFSFFILVLITTHACSQFFDALRNWRKYRHEVFIGAGVSNYMGDLGGIDRKGVKFFLNDLEFSQFKNSFQGSQRYPLSTSVRARISLIWLISGATSTAIYPRRDEARVYLSS